MDLRGIQLREQIGEGGFGVVYRAYQPVLDREVAVKLVHPRISDAAGFATRFENEARVIARIEHPHVVPLYDYWHDPEAGGAVLVMRLMRGGSLATSLARGPWHPDEVVRLVSEVGAALGAAHRHGVVHGDVKPANVLLDGEGSTSVSDFGIAVDLFQEGEHSAAAGSPAYLAPEQLRGEDVSAAADIYALGVLMWEALIGRHPFEGRDLQAMLRGHLEEQLPAVTAVRSDLDQRWNDVIGMATAKDPGARYRSMADLVAAVAGAPSGRAEVRPVVSTGAPSSLPLRLSSFIGREDEIEAVHRLLGASRLVTLLGPGGVGKSSIAVEAVRRLPEPPRDGALVVDLTDLSDGALLPERVAERLGLGLSGSADPVDALIVLLSSREMVLILDSAEAQLDATAVLVERLLTSIGGVRVVVTSREPLQIPGEARLAVLPLAVDDAGSDAARLFLERSTLVSPDAELLDDAVVEIVEKLDGLPLAIELAAARLGSLSVDQIRDRLDQQLDLLTTRRSSARLHDSLRATLTVSCGLLSAEETAYFRKLSVFRGGFTEQAANAVTAIDGADVLARLVEVSLVTRGSDPEPRYRLLEPVRQYAQELLEAAGEEAEAEEAHLEYFGTFVELGADGLGGPDAARWIVRFNAEESNTTAAVTRALESGRVDDALRLTAKLTNAWTWARRSSTYDQLVPPLLTASGVADSVDLVTLLCFHVLVLQRSGQATKAVAAGRRALDVAERLGDRAAIAAARRRLGFAYEVIDVEQAIEHLTIAVDMYRDLGSVHHEGPLFSLIMALIEAGDLAGARDVLEESRDLAERSDSPVAKAVSLAEEGFIRAVEADTKGAIDAFEQTLEVWKDGENSPWRRNSLVQLADLSMTAGDFSAADEYLAAAAAMDQSMGHRSATGFRARSRRLRLRGDVSSARAELLEGHRQYHEGLWTLLLESALVEAVAGRNALAARLFGITDRALEDRKAKAMVGWQDEIDGIREEVRATLGMAVFEDEYRHGFDLDRQDAIELAIQAALGE